MKDWDQLTVQERIEWLPERHHHTWKCVMYLVMNVATATPWEAVDRLMRNMGFEHMNTAEVSKDGSVSLSAPTYACPDEVKPDG